MKVLVQYEYPPIPAGLSTQGDLLLQGLLSLGVDAHGVHFESDQEKAWYYRWFEPDFVVGIGYWGYTPHLVMHPQQYGIPGIPWLVADGYIANYRDILDNLPLLLVTSNWVKQVYIRDGIRPDNIEILPVGCDTDTFIPRGMDDQKVAAVREILGVAPDEIMLLTVGGDAASKGAQEVMQALALIADKVPKWKYVCKVWPQVRTDIQNAADHKLATTLGIGDQTIYTTGKVSRTFMPYLIAACDIYVGPSRLEGFGMPHIEAGACGKPVVAINAMAFKDTIVHGETGFLAGVAQENVICETILGEAAGFPEGHRVVFDPPRIADYRASVGDIADALYSLMNDPALRTRMGEAGRQRVTSKFDYRVVARQFLDMVTKYDYALKQLKQPESMSLASTARILS